MGAAITRELAAKGYRRTCIDSPTPGPEGAQVEGSRPYESGDVPPDTLVTHGERDERVPLGNILRWAEPQGLPMVVVPGADHFFSRRLPVLVRFVRWQVGKADTRTRILFEQQEMP
jgi:alpha/beta superfamily hydrolase